MSSYDQGYTCIECSHSYDDRDGDLDERMCNKCLDITYEQKDNMVYEQKQKDLQSTTTDDYWDCECKEDYINKKSEKSHCGWCDTNMEDQPDSIVSEMETDRNKKGE